jgi:hypothetical protein
MDQGYLCIATKDGSGFWDFLVHIWLWIFMIHGTWLRIILSYMIGP